MASAKAMQKYYDVDWLTSICNGVVEDENSPLAPLYRLAFTDKHYVWLGEKLDKRRRLLEFDSQLFDERRC